MLGVCGKMHFRAFKHESTFYNSGYSFNARYRNLFVQQSSKPALISAVCRASRLQRGLVSVWWEHHWMIEALSL